MTVIKRQLSFSIVKFEDFFTSKLKDILIYSRLFKGFFDENILFIKKWSENTQPQGGGLMPLPRPPPRYLYHSQDSLCEKSLKIILKNFDPSRRYLKFSNSILPKLFKTYYIWFNSTELVCEKIIPLIFIQLYCLETHPGLLEYKN